jgi:hypothetical protein
LFGFSGIIFYFSRLSYNDFFGLSSFSTFIKSFYSVDSIFTYAFYVGIMELIYTASVFYYDGFSILISASNLMVTSDFTKLGADCIVIFYY